MNDQEMAAQRAPIIMVIEDETRSKPSRSYNLFDEPLQPITRIHDITLFEDKSSLHGLSAELGQFALSLGLHLFDLGAALVGVRNDKIVIQVEEESQWEDIDRHTIEKLGELYAIPPNIVRKSGRV